MDNKLIQVVIAITVGIVVLGSLLVPVITEASSTEKTFTNDGVFYYGIFEPTDTYELTVDGTTGAITVNDVAIDPIVSASNQGSYSLIASDNVLVRYGNNGSYFVQVVGIDHNNNTVSVGGNQTVTITDGQIYIISTDTTRAFNFTEFYGIVPSEDEAVMKQSAQAVYVKGDSEIYGSGLTTVTSWSNMFHIEGTYDDGITISSPLLTTATYDNIKWNIEPVSGYKDLYKLASVEFDITYNDTTVHATYSYFGVPSEVTAEKSQHLDTTEIGLLAVIPVLMIVAFLVFAVRIFAGNRD